MMGLAVLSYFSACGGPFGLEVAIAAGGPAPVVASPWVKASLVAASSAAAANRGAHKARAIRTRFIRNSNCDLAGTWRASR